MRFVKTIKVEDIQEGDYLEDDDKFVEEISYKANHMVVRCAYQRGTYPSTSLMFDYGETIKVIR